MPCYSAFCGATQSIVAFGLCEFQQIKQPNQNEAFERTPVIFYVMDLGRRLLKIHIHTSAYHVVALALCLSMPC
jgi:hypothetical protein